MKDIKSDIIFWVDTGSCREVLESNVLKEGHSKEVFDMALYEMIADDTLVMGNKSGFIVVTDFMPNTAKKLRNE